MEGELPRQLAHLVLTGPTQANGSIELHSDGDVPLQSFAIVLEPHFREGCVTEIGSDKIIEVSFDFLQAVSEVVDSREHHVYNSRLSLRADILVEQVYLGRYLSFPQLPPQLVIDGISIDPVLAPSKIGVLVCVDSRLSKPT